MPVNQAFEELTDTSMWTSVAAIGAGYMGSSLVQTLAEGVSPFDLPNEVYGAGVVAAATYTDAQYSNKVATGGALYTLDAVAQRFGLKNAVTEMV